MDFLHLQNACTNVHHSWHTSILVLNKTVDYIFINVLTQMWHHLVKCNYPVLFIKNN